MEVVGIGGEGEEKQNKDTARTEENSKGQRRGHGRKEEIRKTNVFRTATTLRAM
jgi:hypothetical protein